MTETTADIGYGVMLQRSNMQESPTFADVGQIIDLTLPDLSRDAVEVTHSKSTERWREYVGGLKDGGELSLDINFDPGSNDVANFLADLNTNTAIDYKIVFPDDGTTEWAFSGLLTGFGGATPIGDRQTATATIKLSGKPGFIS